MVSSLHDACSGTTPIEETRSTSCKIMESWRHTRKPCNPFTLVVSRKDFMLKSSNIHLSNSGPHVVHENNELIPFFYWNLLNYYSQCINAIVIKHGDTGKWALCIVTRIEAKIEELRWRSINSSQIVSLSVRRDDPSITLVNQIPGRWLSYAFPPYILYSSLLWFLLCQLNSVQILTNLIPSKRIGPTVFFSMGDPISTSYFSLPFLSISQLSTFRAQGSTRNTELGSFTFLQWLSFASSGRLLLSYISQLDVRRSESILFSAWD